ncbi:DoxX family protein [Hwanghaeella grinnelliae]|uniref:DoxX family protein n=1 Tax=Hwanghaeella grinnelliae TaxID=2500179 RepID=A0A3S3ULH3_9PROT|nr:DoxX family protein [Hwanghaeella grinnelliae]RVU34070.1 DoxX family protein [Hwanghaeella grinnelliae]
MAVDAETGANSKLVIPALAPLYSSLDKLAWLALRVATGALLIPHGAQKLFGAFGGGGLEGTANFFGSVGYPAPELMALLVGIIEFVGGICLVLGLLTRPVSVAVAIFMAAAVQFHAANGFFWPAKGFEYPLLWGIAALFFAVKGGGAFSLDRKIGREI